MLSPKVQSRLARKRRIRAKISGTAVRRVVQAQRSTYFCPSCQRRH
ncbi:MAG: hypothetical protein HC880_05055 [Bacteroidia bacterium]|nr:hypothetical protein [Bacteroidia bacterium]